MKRIKTLFVSLVLVVGANAAYAGCLSEYNHALIDCENRYPTGFTLAGCRADAWVSYYGCILDMATG